MRAGWLFLLRVRDALGARYRTCAYRHLAMLDPSARVMATGAVLNPRKTPELVRVGAHSIVRGELFVFNHGGKIDVGDWCFVGENSRIWSAASVTIGNRVLVSHDVNIHDTNGHPTGAAARHAHFRAIATTGHPAQVEMRSAPITIGDDVWIGFGATIMKGVTVGDGAIIAANSVVTHDVPPFTLFAGNPAQFVRQLQP